MLGKRIISHFVAVPRVKSKPAVVHILRGAGAGADWWDVLRTSSRAGQPHVVSLAETVKDDIKSLFVFLKQLHCRRNISFSL